MEVFFVLPRGVGDHAGVLPLVGQRGVVDAEDVTIVTGTVPHTSVQQLECGADRMIKSASCGPCGSWLLFFCCLLCLSYLCKPRGCEYRTLNNGEIKGKWVLVLNLIG